VTLLNTCEKLKMSHEHNVTFEITQRSMRLVIVPHVTIRLKCGSGCGTERIHGTDMEIKCGTERIWIKCVILMSFFASFLRFCVLDLCVFFVTEYNVVVLIIHNICYTAISIKVVTETIVKCTIWALKR
jgi:hypothetical protein